MYFRVILDNFPIIWAGLKTTMVIFVLSSIIALVVGTIVAAVRMSSIAPLRWVSTGYVEFMRNTPLLVQLFLTFLGLPALGIRLDRLTSVVVAVGLNIGAYLSEIIRGGLQSIPKGQLEAAAAIGLSAHATFYEIVLPQAFRAIYPALTNQLIVAILASSVGSIIGTEELTQQVLFVNSRTYRTVVLFVFLSAVYALLSTSLSYLSRIVGNRLEKAHTR